MAENVVGARQLARVSVASGAVTLWLGLLGLVTTPILIHRLGATRYGVFALITIMSAYLSNLEFGFGHATIRFLARARAAEDRREELAVVSTSLAVFLMGGVVAAAVALGAAPWISRTFFHGPRSLRPETTDAIRLGALILLVSFMSSFASAGLQAMARFQMAVLARAVFGTLASASAVAAVLVGGHLRLVLLAQLCVASALCLALLASLAIALGQWVRPRIERSTFYAMGRFGAFVVISGLAYQVLLQGPPTVLAHFASTAQVAAFAVPNLVLQQLLVVATSTSVAFMPFASGASVRGDRSHLSVVYQSNLRLTLAVIGPVAVYLAVFAHTLLSAWIGRRFAGEAAAPLQFLAMAVTMLALSAAPADVLRGLGKPRWVAVFTICAAAISVGASFVAAKSHGAGGVAFALALGTTASTLPLIALVGMRLLDLRLRDLAGALAGPLVAVAAVATLFGIVALAVPGLAAALAAGIVGVTVYSWLTYKAVLSARERAPLAATWEPLTRRLTRQATGGPPPANA